MQIEELNKSQIVLLTLLTSFVTSLATGIVTVSLMEQGVMPVTNTVNRIVERTKEVVVKVVEPQDPVVITETKEVVIRQADLVAEAVAKTRGSFVTVYKVAQVSDGVLTVASTTGTSSDEQEHDSTVVAGDDNAESESTNLANAIDSVDALAQTTVEQEQGTSTQILESTEAEQTELVFVARAVAIGTGGYITDASVIATASTTEYVILGPNKKRVQLKYIGQSNGVAMMSTDGSGKALAFASVAVLKPGQAVVVLSGTERLRVLTTIIADVVLVDGIASSVELGKSVVTPGSILITTEGKLAGMSTGASRSAGPTWLTTSEVLEKALHTIGDAEPAEVL